MGRQIGNYRYGKTICNGCMKKPHRFSKETCTDGIPAVTSPFSNTEEAEAYASARKLKHHWGKELPGIALVWKQFSLLARGMSVSLASCWCKVPSMYGPTTRRVTTRWRTWLDSNRCKDTSSSIRRCYFSARNGRRTQMAMRRQLHTALKIH